MKTKTENIPPDRRLRNRIRQLENCLRRLRREAGHSLTGQSPEEIAEQPILTALAKAINQADKVLRA